MDTTKYDEPLKTVKKLLHTLEEAQTIMYLTASMLEKTADDITKTVKDLGVNVVEAESLESLGIKVAKS